MSSDKTIVRDSSAVAGTTLNRSELPEIPGFTIEQELARGGMGAVYKASQEWPKRTVAIKSILGQYRDDEFFKKAFLAEVELLASLQSEHTINIYQALDTADGLYLVMQYADNGSLADRLKAKGGKLPEREAVAIITGIAKALEEAHLRDEQPIIHLDVKPENILFSGDWPMLSDFGIATIKEPDDGAQGTFIKGDPRYWAPEQADGYPCAASDIYSLGLVFFELLTGKKPEKPIVYNNEDERAITRQLPPALRKYGSVIAACLQKDADQRPDSKTLQTIIAAALGTRTIWQKVRIPVLLALVAANFVLNPSARDWVSDLWLTVFPPPAYAVVFAIEPAGASLWVDGQEQVFRELELTRGTHEAVVVANNYIGVHRAVAVDAGEVSFDFNLTPLAAASDAEYLEFAADFGRNDQLLDKQWIDQTLQNMVDLEKMNRTEDPGKEDMIRHLQWLADAGDAVAQTTLYYAAFEDLDVGGSAQDYFGGLGNASNNGYALATILQSMHILNELFEAGQDFDSNPDAFVRVIGMLRKASAQGMARTAGMIARRINADIGLDSETSP